MHDLPGTGAPTDGERSALTAEEQRKITDAILALPEEDRERLLETPVTLLRNAFLEVASGLPRKKEYKAMTFRRGLRRLSDEAWRERFEDGNRYDWVYYLIRESQKQLCPEKEEGKSRDPYREEAEGEVIPETICYNKPMTTQEVLADLKARGLRAATFEELDEFAEANNDLQSEEHPIVALGSQVPFPDGDVGVPVFSRSGSGRGLGLYWGGPQVQWLAGDRFLALPR